MKTKLWWGVLLVACALFLYVWFTSKQKAQTSEQRPAAAVPRSTAVSLAMQTNHVVKVPTGQERLSTAIDGMAYTIGLANKLPNEEKRTIMSLAGVFFFHDCLMTKMKNGRITMTTNELCQLFSNAVAQVYSNKLPPDLAVAMTNQVFGNMDWAQTLDGIREHEQYQREHPDGALVHGFDFSFGQRNNLHMTLAQSYEWMSKGSPALGRKIKMIGDALSSAGVVDAEQSDVKDNCLAYAMMNTSELSIFGKSMPSEYHLYATNYAAVMQWRLEKMFGLDEGTAKKVVKNLARVPVDEFKSGDVQPPAYLQ